MTSKRINEMINVIGVVVAPLVAMIYAIWLLWQRLVDWNDIAILRLVGLLAFGEGWHNNHHAFPRSAFPGLRWWQFDLSA